MSDDQKPVSGKQKAVFDILKAMGKDMLMIPDGATIKLLGEMPKFHTHHLQFKNGKLMEAAAPEPKTITLDSLGNAPINLQDYVDQFEYDPLKKAFFEKPQDPPFKLAGMDVHVDPALGPDQMVIHNYPIQGAIADQLMGADFSNVEKMIMASIGEGLSKHMDAYMINGTMTSGSTAKETVNLTSEALDTLVKQIQEGMMTEPTPHETFKTLTVETVTQMNEELYAIEHDQVLSDEEKKLLKAQVLAANKMPDKTVYTRDELIGLVYTHAAARLKNKGWHTVYCMPKEDVDALIGPKTKSPYMAVRKVSINWVQRKDLWEHFELVDVPEVNALTVIKNPALWETTQPPEFITDLGVDDENDTFMAGK